MRMAGWPLSHPHSELRLGLRSIVLVILDPVSPVFHLRRISALQRWSRN